MKTAKGLLWIAALMFVGFSLSLSACADNREKSEEEKSDHLLDLQDDVMAIHDEVMPLNNDLRVKANELMAYTEKKGEELDEAKQREVRTLVERLENAREGMMTWMNDWSETDRDGMEYEDAVKYFEREKERITEVAEKMRSSREDAKKFLEKHKERKDDKDKQ